METPPFCPLRTTRQPYECMTHPPDSYRFAPSARCLAEWIRNTTSADPSFRLDVPVSHVPPLHPALACLAVMPR